jgi:hypothetical protein
MFMVTLKGTVEQVKILINASVFEALKIELHEECSPAQNQSPHEWDDSANFNKAWVV